MTLDVPYPSTLDLENTPPEGNMHTMYQPVTPATRPYRLGRVIGGLLSVIVPIIGLSFLAGPLLASHPAWQKEITVTVQEATYVPNDGGSPYQNLNVADKAGDDFDLFGWNINVWSDGHNSLVAQGQTIKVWAMLGTDSFEGAHVVAVSQTKYGPQMHWIRVILFVILCIIGAIIVFALGVPTLFRR